MHLRTPLIQGLYIVQFSVTDIENYKRCRRKWHLTSISQNRLALTSRLPTSAALDLGTLQHKTLATWITDFDLDPIGIFMGHSSDRMKECIANYKETVGCAPNDEELDPLYEAIDLGRAMISNYKEYHKIPLPKNMTYMSPEQGVTIPMPGTEHPCDNCEGTGEIAILELIELTVIKIKNEYTLQECPKCGGRGYLLHELTCTFDGLIQDVRDNVYILEHKTYATTPNLYWLKRNDQFVGYLWAANYIGKHVGWNVKGLAYDGMLKKAKPPRNKTMADLFIRLVLDRTEHEMEMWHKQAAVCMNEMAQLPFELGPELWPNRRWEGCYDCGVEKLCTMIDLGEDWEATAKRNYTKRKIEESVGPVQ